MKVLHLDFYKKIKIKNKTGNGREHRDKGGKGTQSEKHQP